jgi:hypothetical protein
MAEHTPGPWEAVKDDEPLFHARQIASVWHNESVPKIDGYANARLIAKAWLIPELVNALEDAIKVCSCCGGTGRAHTHSDETEVGCSPGSSAIPCPNCTDWRAALAKAKDPAP